MPKAAARSPEHTLLSKEVTVAHYRAMKAANDRVGLGGFMVARFNERYFRPVMDPSGSHGFTQMAVSCLVIEALQCFYEGLPDSKTRSKAVFQRFFARRTGLEVFGEGPAHWFYEQVRCGILHQAEAAGGWRILRSGPLLDEQARSINAKRFIVRLQKVVADQAAQLEVDDALWQNFCVKMDAVCENCEAP
jgi:hypothetical protein